MDDKKLRLQVITPSLKKVDLFIDMLIMRTVSGDMGVLYAHAPCCAALQYGALRIISQGRERKLAVYGGLALIEDNTVTILTPDAHWPDEINVVHANADRDRAQKRLQEKIDDIEIQNDQVLLRRALVQIEVGSHTFTEPE